LKKIGSATEQEATPAILGMVRVVSHLVSVEEVPAANEPG
jgi:large subunit ribosomal protein L30